MMMAVNNGAAQVALRMESVDRNLDPATLDYTEWVSLSVWRAWIEIHYVEYLT